MIKFEYDVNTSGTRISFVIRDCQTSCGLPPDISLLDLGRHEGDTYVIPQTSETLSIIAAMVKHAQQYERDYPSLDEKRNMK